MDTDGLGNLQMDCQSYPAAEPSGALAPRVQGVVVCRPAEVAGRPAWKLACKRLIDVFGSGLCIVLFLPFALLIVALIRISSPGPAVYRSRRVGEGGRLFTMYKFRTMVSNADELKSDLAHLNERDGVLFKITDDPRIIPFGRFLRRYSLDEFPQLLNVFVGDMSLVGPRPPILEECLEYTEEQARRIKVKPGITGLWQVQARTDPSFERYVALDLKYIENWNLNLDIEILRKTFGAVVRGTGA
jgi:lipopolysaccharide/colanic/teichoic acid biosynthesis glycosyltransferase